MAEFVLTTNFFYFQRVFESAFVGRRSIVKERFSKKYRHPTLDSKLTLKRLNAVGLFNDSILLSNCLKQTCFPNQSEVL